MLKWLVYDPVHREAVTTTTKQISYWTFTTEQQNEITLFVDLVNDLINTHPNFYLYFTLTGPFES